MQASKWLIAAAAALLFTLGDTGTCLARAGEAPSDAPRAASATPQPDIVMYATKDCGYCKKARAYFTERHLAWREIDIDGSAAAQQEWQAKGGRGTPLIFIGNTRIDGYVQGRIDEALAQYAP